MGFLWIEGLEDNVDKQPDTQMPTNRKLTFGLLGGGGALVLWKAGLAPKGKPVTLRTPCGCSALVWFYDWDKTLSKNNLGQERVH